METHFCKICKRAFPNGRSLGGHMRSHIMTKSSFNSKGSSESRYGLREKPKKSRWFDDEDVELEEKETWSTGVDDDQEEELEVITECKEPRNKRQGMRLKLVEAISASSSPAPSSPEYGAMCLMMLSRDAGSFSDGNEVKRSESDILKIGIKKVDPFPSESGFHIGDDDDDEAEFKEDVNFASVFESGNTRKSRKRYFAAGIENFSKRSKYECASCNKSFHSYQALGGHCASHKKIRVDSSSVLAAVAENLISQKFRSYECPICAKVFPSGQALGGHKRSHLIAGNSAASAATVSAAVIEIEQKNSELNSLDLNLPASDYEICDSFDSNRSIEEKKFTAFQESSRFAAFMM
ncbi:zinc finger protein ZAT4-like [Dendrobium catenatum]|uniref:Zinc finger protein ZAT1 n=1 Tax=Dendrobium catenatum TaxID=906689 RepID=A0A2I0WGZ5_9ASPA|nr:zinc finger protein ZAT4-like [Dendrobium catenatum]PKU74918.1 Zinc finger protein ZAT1 [Dendrobium catenatum]